MEFLYQVGASSANSNPGAGEHNGLFLEINTRKTGRDKLGIRARLTIGYSYLSQVEKPRKTNPPDLNLTPAKLLVKGSHTVTPTLLEVGAQPISLACRSRASDRHLICLIRKRAKEGSVPFSIKRAR